MIYRRKRCFYLLIVSCLVLCGGCRRKGNQVQWQGPEGQTEVLLLTGTSDGEDRDADTGSSSEGGFESMPKAGDPKGAGSDFGCISEAGGTDGSGERTAGMPEAAQNEEADKKIYVDVCGAVKDPGVYELKEGARIFEAVDLAGGLREEADRTSLNQAAAVSDGMQIRVYTKEETADRSENRTGTEAGMSGTDTGSGSDGSVNLNTATAEELTSLSGIGPSRAEDIISYREQNGGFHAVEEIMNISGIKGSTFNKIKDRIVVE